MNQQKTRGPDKKTRKRKKKQRSPGPRVPAHMRGNSLQPSPGMKMKRYSPGLLDEFIRLMATEVSFREIQKELVGKFKKHPKSLQTLQTWGIKFDSQIREARRALEQERLKWIVRTEEARLEALTFVASHAIDRVPEALGYLGTQLANGDVSVAAYLKAVCDIIDTARVEQKGSAPAAGDGGGGVGGNVYAEVILALTEKAQNAKELSPQLEELFGSLRSSLVGHPDIAGRLGK
ncbi:MAG: hypothetical protein KAW17_09500 [Candidatus Eisenbacteria sp.]|nr:hypothetical protein [Candidatus Eisenbacteria bacterium]